jgi:protein TonB
MHHGSALSKKPVFLVHHLNAMKLLIILFVICSAGMSLAQTEVILQEPEPVAQPNEIAYPDSNQIYTVPENQAEFPGGQTALLRFLNENLHYPEFAMEQGLQGRCYIRFVVTATGEVTHVEVLRGVKDCEACDREAMRVVKKMPRWKPATMNGKSVNCYYTLPIGFTLT